MPRMGCIGCNIEQYAPVETSSVKEDGVTNTFTAPAGGWGAIQSFILACVPEILVVPRLKDTETLQPDVPLLAGTAVWRAP